jgi:hypothetical protein
MTALVTVRVHKGYPASAAARRVLHLDKGRLSGEVGA